MNSKTCRILFLVTCLALSGCGRPDESQREVLSKLDAIKAELSKEPAPVRWATAKRNEISMAIFNRSREKLEQFKKSEALSPEIEAKITAYETLKAELQQKEMKSMQGLRQIPIRTLKLAPGAEAPLPQAPAPSQATDVEYEALSKKVAEAKAPIADIVDQRDRKAAEYRQEYSVEGLLAEYAMDRFDLIVDSSYESQFRPVVLYRTGGEATDITRSVITLFKEKTKQ